MSNGIDISHHNVIDLTKLSYDFCICKATEGVNFNDSKFDEFMKTLGNLGKWRGAYHYANGKDIRTEGNLFISRVKPYLDGYTLLCLDWEQQNNALFNSGSDEAWCRRWCDYVKEQTGCTPVIYVQSSMVDKVKGTGYPLWVARYATNDETGYQDTPTYGQISDCFIRQYTSRGKLSGYGGRLDLDKLYGTYKQWMEYSGYKEETKEPEETPSLPYEPLKKWKARKRNLYTVQEGDYLEDIAEKFRVTVDDIKATNAFVKEHGFIYVGMRLAIYTETDIRGTLNG